MICRLKKSIYNLKQASKQFVISFGLKKYVVDQCMYLKVSENKFIILTLYVGSNLGLLHETNNFLIKIFLLININETTYIISIKIFRNVL